MTVAVVGWVKIPFEIGSPMGSRRICGNGLPVDHNQASREVAIFSQVTRYIDLSGAYPEKVAHMVTRPISSVDKDRLRL